jgi:RecB family exonuclease
MTEVPYMSNSRFSLYLECPLRYRLRYVDKLPEAPHDYFSLGRTVHSALEAFVRPLTQRPDPPAPMSVEELYAVYDSVWERSGYQSESKEHENYAAGKEMIRKFHAKYIASPPTPLFVEQELTAPMQGFSIMGIIDRVDLTPEGALRIVDYKTGKRVSQKDADESKQLMIYQTLAESTYSLPVASLSLYHTVTGKEYDTPRRSDDEVFALITQMSRVVDDIRADRFEPNKGEWCRRCEHRSICPAWV